LKAVIKIESYHYIKSESTEETETHYYITRSAESTEKPGKAIRPHWRIENSLHWVFIEHLWHRSSCPAFVLYATD
jgi:predicted transposase YbfD/YdcC